MTFWYQKTPNSTFRTGWHSLFLNTCPMNKQVLTAWLHLCRTTIPSLFSSLQSPFSHIPHASDHPVSLSHKCPKVDVRIVLPPPRLAACWINPFSLQTLVSHGPLCMEQTNWIQEQILAVSVFIFFLSPLSFSDFFSYSLHLDFNWRAVSKSPDPKIIPVSRLWARSPAASEAPTSE